MKTQRTWVDGLMPGEVLGRLFPTMTLVFVAGGNYPRIRVRRPDGKVVSMLAHHCFPTPIQIPSGCPSYVWRSVQQQSDGALQRAIDGSTAAKWLESEAQQALSNEADQLRRAFDGEKPNGVPVDQDWWLKWGYRTLTRAKRDAARLAHFREALTRKDISHVTSGHPCSPNVYHVYAIDPKSPSGCHLVESASHDLPGVEEVLAASGRRTCQGAQRGEQANRRAMTGR